MGATALKGKFDYYQGRLMEGYMDWWYDALGIVFHLTVNKYFRGMYTWHSVHYVPSKTSISFVSKASTSMLFFSICETFWVLSSRLFRSQNPCKCNSNNASDEMLCTVGVKRGICGSTRPSCTSMDTQMLAE